jgi:hypothetical protein
MNVWRSGVAVISAIVSLYAVAEVAVWHDPLPLPIAIVAILVCALALLERGRYRSGETRGRNVAATSETFFDPTTGRSTRVFYDPHTGAREYRPDTSRSDATPIR